MSKNKMQADILLIESSPLTRRSFEAALRECGYSVVSAVNAAQAQAALLTYRPDLVLLDLQLPDSSTEEIVKLIQKQLDQDKFPIIGIGSRLETTSPPYEDAFSLLLQRPLEPEHLCEAVMRLLPSSPEGQTPAGQGHFILVVDDDTMHRRLLYLQLQREGFVVLAAEDGLEGLKIARTHRPALVVADLLMPNIGGLRLAREMAEDPVLASIPVILISAALDSVPNLPEASELGVVAIVEKSPNPRHLLEKIQNTLALPIGRVPPAPPSNPKHARQLENQNNYVAEMQSMIQVQRNQLSVLAGVSAVLAQQQDIREVLKDALARCMDLTFVTKAAAWYYTPDNALHQAAVEGLPEEEAGNLRNLLESSTFSDSLWHGELVLLRSQITNDAATQEVMRSLGLTVLLLVPFMQGPEHYGVLMLGGTSDVLRRMGYVFGRAIQGQLFHAALLDRTMGELRDSEKQMQDLANYCGDALVFTNQAGRMTYANVAACQFFGVERSVLVGRFLQDFVSNFQADTPSWDSVVETQAGRQVPVRIATRPIGHRRLLRGHVIRELADINYKKSMMARVRMQDPITGLLNRQEWIKKLHQTINYPPRQNHFVAVFVLHLQGLAAVSAHHGEKARNQLLRMVGTVLSAGLRKGDEGGRVKEYDLAVFHVGVDRASFSGMAERLRGLVQQAVPAEQVTVRIGWTEGWEEDDAEAVVARAEAALQQEEETIPDEEEESVDLVGEPAD